MFKNLNRILSRKSLPSQNYSAKILLSELDVMLIELILHIFFFLSPMIFIFPLYYPKIVTHDSSKLYFDKNSSSVN